MLVWVADIKNFFDGGVDNFDGENHDDGDEKQCHVCCANFKNIGQDGYDNSIGCMNSSILLAFQQKYYPIDGVGETIEKTIE